MLVPLMILAFLSVVGGLVGIGNRFEHFLEPVFGIGSRRSGWRSRKQRHGIPSDGRLGAGRSSWASSWPTCSMSASPISRRRSPTAWTVSTPQSLNKYYVDELYAKLFVKPLIDGSTSILWQGVDRKVIDDSVNNAADGARHVSDEVRHMQSGNLRSYAGWIAAGSAVVIAYMIWMGVR